jgi:thioredoxin reductase
MLAPGRAAFGDPTVFLCNELDRLGVPIAYGTNVTGAMAVGLAADVVVVATGGRPHSRSTPAPPAGRALDGDSYLAMAAAGAREASLGGTADSAPVAVIGGSWTGCHIAAVLLESGRRVILVETRETLGYDMGDQQGMVLRDRVADLAEVRLGATLEELGVAEITIWNSADDRQETLEIDGVVVASGLESDPSLRDEIVARVGDAIEVHRVGDCALPRKLADALLDGATVGAQI